MTTPERSTTLLGDVASGSTALVDGESLTVVDPVASDPGVIKLLAPDGTPVYLVGETDVSVEAPPPAAEGVPEPAPEPAPEPDVDEPGKLEALEADHIRVAVRLNELEAKVEAAFTEAGGDLERLETLETASAAHAERLTALEANVEALGAEPEAEAAASASQGEPPTED